MRPAFLKYAQQNAPRYTSYPTAPHFTPAVDGAVYTRWLSELPADASISLYVHVPYCKQMCWYCGCHAFSVRRDDPVADYVAALTREIATTGAVSAARQVRELHWGGGTPNSLSPERFEALYAALGEAFDLCAIERHAIEIDPRLLTKAQAESYARLGVNRVSLGVQDFAPDVQAAIGRHQPFDAVRDAAARLRDAGVAALSFDLMYGLPRQTLESVRRTAELALSLRPARFSVFGYAHVPWFKQRQRLIDAAELPGAEARLSLAAEIRATLMGAGYAEIGYDHYALPDDPIAVAAGEGVLRRNFQGFVESACDVLIGLGPSSISTLPQGYAQNESNVTVWRGAINEGRMAIARGIALSEDDKLRREMIMRLVCDFTLDLGAFGGAARFADELERLAPLAADGLVIVEGETLRVPTEARPFVRLAAQAFDAYALSAARHSAAV